MEIRETFDIRSNVGIKGRALPVFNIIVMLPNGCYAPSFQLGLLKNILTLRASATMHVIVISVFNMICRVHFS